MAVSGGVVYCMEWVGAGPSGVCSDLTAWRAARRCRDSRTQLVVVPPVGDALTGSVTSMMGPANDYGH